MELLTPEPGLFVWVVISLLALAGWIGALVSILRGEFKGHHDKLIWVLVVVFLPVIGSLLYFFIGRAQRINQ